MSDEFKKPDGLLALENGSTENDGSVINNDEVDTGPGPDNNMNDNEDENDQENDRENKVQNQSARSHSLLME